MSLHLLNSEELRATCKSCLENFEFWLKRLIHEQFSQAYGENYMEYRYDNGDYLIKSEIRQNIRDRLQKEPNRYQRAIDAAWIAELINLVTSPRYYNKHFAIAFKQAFPDGCNEARTFLERLLEPRNRLSHANPISVRQAEQVICYCNDSIESIKTYYRENDMATEYDVALILKYSDSLGNLINRENWDSPPYNLILKKPEFYLRPGDIFSAEIEIDSSYESTKYNLHWFRNGRSFGNKTKITSAIEDSDIGENFFIEAQITMNRNWHRHYEYDDRLLVSYKVLPRER